MKNKIPILLFFFFLLLISQSFAQCISTFPYVEDFETTQAWTAVTVPGSVGSSDWAWGTPNHTYVIKSAGSGIKCWCAGGLTGSFYTYWEQSYVISPCFDFTNLKYPHIKFKLFYDIEYHFDGGNLQYSIDGGSTWVNVGAYNDPNDCNTNNWYNYQGINYLNNPAWITVNDGWCGNVEPGGVGWDPQHAATNCLGGNGSGKWVTAEHCLTGLAGQPNVLLRFTFGAGFACNDFDGLAFDSVAVSNGIANDATFNYVCLNLNTFNFTATPNACPTNTYAWNFGDPASGLSNTAAIQNPSHTFSGQGTHTVTLIASGGACNPPDTIIQVVNTATAPVSSSSVSCNGGNNGTAAVTMTGGAGPYSYAWSNGQTTSAISNLFAGNYSVLVTTPSGCPVTATVIITQPTALTTSVITSSDVCGQSNGTATVSVLGGNVPYTYLWNPTASATAAATGLSSGTYSITITDVNGCTTSNLVTVAATGSILAYANNSTICTGQVATLTASGGVNYNWNNGATTSSINVSPVITSTYSVFVSMGNCRDTALATITVNQSPSVNLGSNQTICAGENITLDAGNPGASYLWSTSATTQTINVSSSGNFWVIVALNNCLDKDTIVTYNAPSIHLTDSSLCTIAPIVLNPGSGATSYYWSTGSTSQAISVDTAGIYWVTAMYGNCSTTAISTISGMPGGGTLFIPNAFTPNGDNRNEIFLATGTNIASFDMKIFDRWGNLIFASDDVTKGWDGKIQGGHYVLKKDGSKLAQEDVYVWVIDYALQCAPKSVIKKIGHVSIVK